MYLINHTGCILNEKLPLIISDEVEERNLRRISYLKAREDDRLATPQDLQEEDGGGGGFVTGKKWVQLLYNFIGDIIEASLDGS